MARYVCPGFKPSQLTRSYRAMTRVERATPTLCAYCSSHLQSCMRVMGTFSDTTYVWNTLGYLFPVGAHGVLLLLGEGFERVVSRQSSNYITTKVKFSEGL